VAYKAHELPHPLGIPREIQSSDTDGASAWRGQTCQDAQQGGLAGAICSHERFALSLVQLEIDAT